MDIALASTLRDNCALQADAIQARKDLLARFSQFDQLARKIERLPPTVHGLVSPTQKRLQQAIFSRATIYLQRNVCILSLTILQMFPFTKLTCGP